MKACDIDGCERKHYGGGFCAMHYKRWRKHGDPLAGGTWYATPEEAFIARTEPLCWSECIVWTGPLEGGGYGRLRVNGRMVYAHRYAFEREHGPIPEGMFIDHVCFERSCVNTEHLRLATHAENSQNRSGAWKCRMHDLPRGVTRNGRGYAARVKHNGTEHYLGTYDTPEQAAHAASEARRIHFGIFAGNA